MGELIGAAVARAMLALLVIGLLIGGACVLAIEHCPYRVRVERAN